MPDPNMSDHLNGISIDNAQHGGGYGTKPWFMGQHDAAFVTQASVPDGLRKPK